MPALLLPPTIVQPLDLRYLADDFHILAHFSGHSDYEAVEAMISARQDGTYTVRAILTRHDQSQVDHVNDEALLALAARSGRTTVHRTIEVAADFGVQLPIVDVRFSSHKHEPIHLRVVCASPPDPGRGGLTDPGSHAIQSSLPVMLRGASAMAAPSSRVSIAGNDYPIPEKVRAGPYFTGHDGYFTRSYHMAILRLGRRHLRVLQRPAALDVGGQWVYETEEGTQTYNIAVKDSHGNLTITSSGYQSEVVRGLATTDGLVLTEVAVRSARTPDEGVSISFMPDGTFAIRVDAQPTVVTGSALRSAETELLLQPAQPSWAIKRPLRLQWYEAGAMLTIDTLRGEA